MLASIQAVNALTKVLTYLFGLNADLAVSIVYFPVH